LKIKNLVFDCDGVLTDGRLYYSKQGKLCIAFHANDSVGCWFAKDSGLRVIMVSSGSDKITKKLRADEIGIEYHYIPFMKKHEGLSSIVNLEETAYIGDCFDDIPVFKKCAVSFVPSDALPEVKKEADFVLKRGGGCGCVLEAVLRLKERNYDIS